MQSHLTNMMFIKKRQLISQGQLSMFLFLLMIFICRDVVAENHSAKSSREKSVEDAAEVKDLWPMPSAILGENSRFALDLSSRVINISRGDSSNTGYMQQLGVDIHKVISAPRKDLATVVIQLYAARIDNLNPHPPFFESENDWEILKKINTINITALSRGSFNILLGHIELPYGLEYSIDTNTTLRQTPISQNLGLKADWGGGINGNINSIQYDFVVTRGSGMEYDSNGSPYAITGRIGSAFGSQSYFPSSGWGLSLFHGELMKGGTKIKRSRAGIDYQRTYGAFGLLSEFSWGKDDGMGRGMLFAEGNWTNANEQLFAYTQLKAALKDTTTAWDDKLTWTIGLDLFHANGLNLSFQYSKDIRSFDNTIEFEQLQFQIRYRI